MESSTFLQLISSSSSSSFFNYSKLLITYSLSCNFLLSYYIICYSFCFSLLFWYIRIWTSSRPAQLPYWGFVDLTLLKFVFFLVFEFFTVFYNNFLILKILKGNEDGCECAYNRNFLPDIHIIFNRFLYKYLITNFVL